MATFETNSDGTTIVILSEPIKVGKEELTRCTIPKLRGKHLMGLPPLDSLGQFIAFAARVVLPMGAVEEMCPEDANDVGNRLFAEVVKKTQPANSASGQSGSE
jgi:hypothetical protein